VGPFPMIIISILSLGTAFARSRKDP